MTSRRWATTIFLLWLAGGIVPAQAQDTSEFFDDSRLHDVELWVHGDDWLRLREGYLENTYYPADVAWNGVRVHNAGIRSRGNASRDPRKPGLRVDIDRYVSGQRFLGLKSFILDNSTQDASLLKQRLAMQVFARMGLPAPRQAHARVHVNGTYVGLYLLVESVDKDLVERTYQGRASRTGGRERDGVIFDYRWVDEYDFRHLGHDLLQYAARFKPSTHEHAPQEFLYGPLRDLTRVIEEAPDDRFEEFVNAYLDLDQWVRYVAVENVLAEEDGMLGFAGMNNFYLYRFEHGLASQVIPWDKDQSFEEAGRSIWHNAETNVLMRRAMTVPRLRALYLETLQETARAVAAPAEDDPRGWLEREADRALAQIRQAALADPTKPWTNEEFLHEAARVQHVVRARPPFVACEASTELVAPEERHPCTTGVTAPAPSTGAGLPPTATPPPTGPSAPPFGGRTEPRP
jgi:hypothetical protein